ncbi:MAG: helix-turn-helix domain-containing protein, partial [Candidatus Bathyarchaeota archaeon]|uniref:helix-turn-helix domain-containing protein n=1 Tax=Candidatus Bathycorpusculum sp. TaxID=2994959 RepID=UPI00281F9E1B|nr:helix-turn-helix domain-containing protein [Candidatus Termiticorpusculum sp.]
KRIQTAYNATNSTISGVAKRFVTDGMEAALGRKKQLNYHRKVTGEVEAHICAIACSQPPEGRLRWTMQTIADKLIQLNVIDYITDTTVCEVMKKNEIKPWQVKEWCIPKANAEYVAKMEDILDVYQRPL